jgi:hypothetical protein
LHSLPAYVSAILWFDRVATTHRRAASPERVLILEKHDFHSCNNKHVAVAAAQQRKLKACNNGRRDGCNTRNSGRTRSRSPVYPRRSQDTSQTRLGIEFAGSKAEKFAGKQI